MKDDQKNFELDIVIQNFLELHSRHENEKRYNCPYCQFESSESIQSHSSTCPLKNETKL